MRRAEPVIPPADLLAEMDRELAHLGEQERSMFRLRVERWWEPLLSGLADVYDDALGVARRCVILAAAAYGERDAALRLRDLRRLLEPDWFQRPEVIGYAAYAERFAPGSGLHAVGERVDHLRALGVSYLHLMPLLQPRPEPNDGGYAVADYRTVRPDLGDIDDLRSLTGLLHEAGISLCLDLVLNHVAAEHEWAARARAGEQRYREYFRIFPDRAEPDEYERTLPEVFPDFAPGSFTWDDDVAGWVWTTFNSYQWDLNWTNPDVFAEMLDVVLYLANAGVDVLRLDAIAFLWKRKGTSCQNQPEVHAITQALRAAVRMACPGVLFLAEAIVSPTDLVPYLGQRRHYGRLSDLAYHNTLMVQLWSMLATRRTDLTVQAVRRMPPIPPSTSWLTYLRCHDDIGWAVEDQDAEAVGLSGPGHRHFLSDFYSGRFEGSFARGLVFQENEQTGDRRISGSAASLAGLELALAQGDRAGARSAVARVLLTYTVICFWGGIPVIWYGDEVAELSDPRWADEPGHEADNRWTHRPRLDWARIDEVTSSQPPDPGNPGDLIGVAEDPASEHAAARLVWHGLRRVLSARRTLPHLHAATPAEVVDTPDIGVLGVRRPHPLGPAVGLFNVTEREARLSAGWIAGCGLDPDTTVDALSGQRLEQGPYGELVLPPYGALWLVDQADG